MKYDPWNCSHSEYDEMWDTETGESEYWFYCNQPDNGMN